MLYDPKWQKEVKTEPWRQALRHAADSIERVGWCQHQEYELNGDRMIGMCTEYAIHTAFCCFMKRVEARERLITYLNGISISDWNDLPGQRVENVLAALRACADA